MTESKKSWVEPELIVLVRSKPEEAVLTACKISSGDGQSTNNNGCYESSCTICAILLGS